MWLKFLTEFVVLALVFCVFFFFLSVFIFFFAYQYYAFNLRAVCCLQQQQLRIRPAHLLGLVQDAAQIPAFFPCLSPFNDGLTIEAFLIDSRDALPFYTLLFQADGVVFTLIISGADFQCEFISEYFLNVELLMSEAKAERLQRSLVKIMSTSSLLPVFITFR